MFKYTKASIDILIRDCKKYAKIFKIVSLIGTLALLTYQIVTGFINNNKLVYVNVALASLFVIYSVLDFVFGHYKKKTARKISKRIYKWIKIITKAFTLGFTIYEISVAEKLDGVQIILTTLMIALWILSFASEIVVEVVEARANEFIIALKEDVKPVTTVSNVFKKITGKEVVVEPEDPKKEKVLNKLNDFIETKKEQKKINKKHLIK